MQVPDASQPSSWPYSDAGHRQAPPVGRVAQALLIALRGYKVLLSPLLSGYCRFHPSCADYASEAVRVHGALKGSFLSARRVSRCRPFGRHGFDPVPPR